MHKIGRITASRLLAGLLCAGMTSLPVVAQVSVRSVKVLGSKDAVEIEVEASERIIPQTQILSGPDRLVVDFPNAVPSDQVRSQSVERGEVKDVRVGLFQKKPPVTRVVLDLTAAQSYQVFPNGRTVIIKVTGGGAGTSAEEAQPARRPGLVVANYTTSAEPLSIVSLAQPPLQVSYEHGLLSISANKATLSEVLYAVQQKTGAEISIPAGAEQERVVAAIEPAPAPEVLAHLLNGSRFNFLIINSASDPRQLDKVILTPRQEMSFTPSFPTQARSNQDVGEDESSSQPGNFQPPPMQGAPGQPEPGMRPPGEENTPQ
ncbi:MAG: AMIN domain-containing protein [Candidatus Sulfotelmatobacter sp.]